MGHMRGLINPAPGTEDAEPVIQISKEGTMTKKSVFSLRLARAQYVQKKLCNISSYWARFLLAH